VRRDDRRRSFMFVLRLRGAPLSEMTLAASNRSVRNGALVNGSLRKLVYFFVSPPLSNHQTRWVLLLEKK
jgi:hypothetical protein